MKKFMMVIVLAVLSVSAFAQDKSNRDANGAVVRGAYATNNWYDNMFVGAGAGVNLFHEAGAYDADWSDRYALAIDAYVGKWFTPSIGARLAYSGLNATSYFDEQSEVEYKYTNVRTDLLWNISNAFGGYRSDRFWSFVPYIGFGWGHISTDNPDFEMTNNAWVANAGLLNLIRVSNRVNITLDARFTSAESSFGAIPGYEGEFLRGDHLGTLTAGLQVNFGQNKFQRVADLEAAAAAAAVAPLMAKIASLEGANKNLSDQNAKLQNEINALKNRPAPAPVVKTSYIAAPLSIFFEIGKAKISEKSLANIDNIASIIKKSDVKYIINGYADSNTGSAKRNQQLSEQRAEAVKEALVKAGVNASQLQTKANGGVKENPYKTPLMNRVAIISAQ